MGESGGGGVAGVDGGETFFCDVFKRKESIFHKKMLKIEFSYF